MHAGGCQMADPPDPQKQHEQEALQSRAVGYHRPLDVPTPPFEITKGGFHPHTPPVRLHAGAPSRLVREEKPGSLIPWLPDDAEKGVQTVLLPDERWAEPGLAGTVDQFAHGVPPACTLAAGRPAGMLSREAQEGMPLPCLAQLDEWQSSQAAIGDECTLGLAYIRPDAIKQRADDGPLPFLPGLL